MFVFNVDKYNFWPLYETIKKYYPIGILKENSKFFNLIVKGIPSGLKVFLID